MPTTHDSLNLDFYRKQARALLKSARSGDSAALERVIQHAIPTRRTRMSLETVALADCQRVLARENGFTTWCRFRDFIVASSSNLPARANAFVEAALDNFEAAERILSETPEVAYAGLMPALLLGDATRVKRLMRMSPERLKEPVGPRNWQPLLYVCFSRYASRQSVRRADIADLAKVLLQHGADPNAMYIYENTEWKLPCLYGATGLNNNPELASHLIDAGAVLDDNESLYHSTEHADYDCVKLLLARGANPASYNVLFHALDREDVELLRLMLDAGGDIYVVHDTRKQTALHWAVWRTRGVEIIAELVKRGVDIDARRDDGRTAYAMAFVSGQTATAEFLASQGANTELLPIDRFVGEFAVAPTSELLRLAARFPEVRSAPEAARMLPDLAISHHTAAVRALIAAGADLNARGDAGATALHWACWFGHADIVEMLLAAGASLTIQDEEFSGTPPGWFGHGIHNCPDRRGDWLGVARALAEVKAELPAGNLPTGIQDVDEFLQCAGYEMK